MVKTINHPIENTDAGESTIILWFSKWIGEMAYLIVSENTVYIHIYCVQMTIQYYKSLPTNRCIKLQKCHNSQVK